MKIIFEVPDDMAFRFDSAIKDRFVNRSEAIRSLMRDAVDKERADDIIALKRDLTFREAQLVSMGVSLKRSPA